MKLVQVAEDRAAYLQPSDCIDWQHTSVQSLAKKLAIHVSTDSAISKACFEWVRDNIQHSWDYQCEPVTVSASQVLHYQNGYCYAKAHLLAALLRANNIAAGFCYQRLSVDGEGEPYCLHGLNAVYLQEFGWYRMDARGNNAFVDAAFTPPREQLAFQLGKGETDFVEILPEPLPIVIQTMRNYPSVQELYKNLPDWRTRSLINST